MKQSIKNSKNPGRLYIHHLPYLDIPLDNKQFLYPTGFNFTCGRHGAGDPLNPFIFADQLFLLFVGAKNSGFHSLPKPTCWRVGFRYLRRAEGNPD